MCPFASLDAEVDPRVDARLPERAQLEQIDASVRVPVVMFVFSGVCWLMLAALLGLIAALKLLNPEFLADCEWFTYGRVYPAAVNAALYGWGCQAAFAVSLWLMARLCAVRVRHLGLMYIAGGFWNLGILVGVAGILLQGPEPAQFLEMPRHVAPFLAFSYVLIAMWGVLSFHYRSEGRVYVSQWYLLAALFWFPWVYSSSVLGIFFAPGRGVVQAVVDSWYVNGLLWMWFVPVALAAIYYFLPKSIGRAVWGYYLSVVAFWSYALFVGWAGTRFLIWGPVPVWYQTVGVCATMLLLAPLFIIGLNHHLTAFTHFRRVWQTPVARFMVFGAVALSVASLVGAYDSQREISVITNFTHFTTGQFVNIFYACFTMVMFGAVYFILPRVLGREWPSHALVRFHFWVAAIGSAVLVLALYAAGLKQGHQLVDPDFPFIEIVRSQAGINRLIVIAGAVLALGQCAFFLNVAWMVATSVCAKCCACLPWARLRPAGGEAR